MPNKGSNSFILLLTSFILAYTSYVYFLQPETSLSRSRLVLAFCIWVLLFSLFYLGFKRSITDQILTRRSVWGAAGIFILINLVATGYSLHTPYAYLFLPTQTVRIKPLSNDTIKLVSYNTELVQEISISNFRDHVGWSAVNNQIKHEGGQNHDLVWQGKPGQFVELEFATCVDCGQVKISWNASNTQEVDLSGSSGGENLILRHDYPPLIGHKLVNLLALELSIFLAGLILSNIRRSLLSSVSVTDRPYLADNPERQTDRAAAQLPPEQASIPSLQGASKNQTPRGQILPILSLAFFTLVVYGLKIQPILFNDDWSIIFTLKFNLMKPFMVYERRPLHWFLAWLSNQFLPLEKAVYGMYLMLVLLSLITAVLIYFVVHQILENQASFALLTAALWLVFPNDYTRLYISTLGIRFAFALLLIVMLFFIRFMRTEKWLVGALTIPLLILSLLMYEGQLGLAFVWPIILVILYWRDISWTKILGIVAYYLAIAMFVYWKLVAQPQIYQDSKIENLNLPPSEILTRYLQAVGTIFGGFQLPYQDGSWLSLGNVAFLIAIVLGLVAIYAILARLNRQEDQTDIDKTLKMNLYIFVFGAVLWIAGYVPIILNYQPNIYGHLSRVNLFSIPGAALILLATIHTILVSMSPSHAIAEKLTIVFVLPLIFVGAVVQLQTQEAYNQSWDEAKIFYQELFNQIPDVRSGTHIILELSGYENNSTIYRPLFSSSWAAWCALRVLYDDIDLVVNYKYNQIAVPYYPSFNILTSTLQTDTISAIGDPGKLIVIDYDRQTHALRIRKDISDLQENIVDDGYSPQDRILPLKAPILSRRIVD
ncbi:MAG: hypothetical protein P8Y03_02215 [Anaerolineales bacterium]